jgi:PAS domain S-box-containing protein
LIGETHYLLQELRDLLQCDPLMFEFFQEGILDGVWYWDLENVENEWMSPKMWRTLGYDPANMKHLAAEWQDIIFKEDLAVALKNFNLHIADPTHPYDQYVRYRHKTGRIVWVRCRGVAIHDNAGQPVRFLGAHVDVTNLMERQEELLSENFKLQQLKRHLQDLEIKTAQLESENLFLKRKVSQSERYELDSYLVHPWYFEEKAKELIELAKRIGAPVNVLTVTLKNYKLIEASFGNSERVNKKLVISNIIHEIQPDMVQSRFVEGTITALTIGLDDTAASAIADLAKQKIKDYTWSIIEPDFQVHVMTKAVFDDVSDILNEIMVTGSQFNTL